MGHPMGHKKEETRQGMGHGTHTSVPVPCPILSELDRIAVTMEKLWGQNVLPLMVEEELRNKFEKQRIKLNEAIESGEELRIDKSASAMGRAWKALDQRARDKGNHPTGKVWVGWTKNNTPICVFTTGITIADLPTKVLRFHIDELVAMIPPEVLRIKGNWPDAKVKETRETSERVPFNDEIPF